MVGVGTMFPLRGTRARQALLACSFALTAALGALAATLFAQAASGPHAAAPPAGAHVALYVQIQSWHEAAQPTDRRLSLQTVLVNDGRDTAPAPTVQDFTVQAADGRLWSVGPADSPFSATDLQPGEQRALNMLVDLPPSASQLRLVMRYRGQVESVQLVS